MSLVGFDLALRHTIKTTVPTTETEIEIALLPVLVVLKMVAWLDRPYERDRDLRDLARVLEEALPVDDPCRYDDQHAVWQSGLEHEDQSAFYVGLEVARLAKRQHREAVEEFLAKVEPPESEGFALMLREARYPGKDPDEILSRRLAAFRLGLDALSTGK